jgi:DNA-binding transcriptional ArsR family regulator
MLDQAVDLDRTFQALADPSRRTMIDRLTLGPASVSELAGPLEMTLAAVVQHVQVLEGSGVVATEKVGRVRMCRIRPEAMLEAERWMAEHRKSWEKRLDRLDDVLRGQARAQASEEER